MNNVVSFLIGLGLGISVTGIVLAKKFQQISDKESADFASELNRLEHEIKKLEAEKDPRGDISNFKEKAEEIMNEYTGNNIPVTISDEEFDKDEESDKEYLTMYSNGVLVYDYSHEVIEDDTIDEMIGIKNLSKVGEYEESMLYIHNPERGINYAIEFVKEEFKKEGDDGS